MILGGLQHLTLIDFPGRVACVAFTQGCNLRCKYCHNHQLLARRAAEGTAAPTEKHLFEFLEKRRDVLDGVVVSGGEPTLQADLSSLLRCIKQLGFLVKLDTNGTNPHVLHDILDRGLPDYIAMDVKHDPARYVEITGEPVDPATLAASRDVILASGVDHEFRTTIIPHLHDEAAVAEIARFCARASRLVLQGVVPSHALEPSCRKCAPPTLDQLRQRKRIAERFVDNVECGGIM